MIELRHISYAYNNLKKNKNKMSSYGYGKHIGYFEACLLQFNCLETIKVDGISQIKTEIITTKKWYRKERKEKDDEAIIRMIEKLLANNKLLSNL